MANRFRNHTMRNIYASMVETFRNRRMPLFTPEGDMARGNGYAGPFWRGYNGVTWSTAGYWDSYSKTTPAYACWCAGRDMAKEGSS